MLIVALAGVVLGYITYEIIYYFNPISPKTTLSWALAFIIGVWRQHALHRRFTFLHKTSYFQSLTKAYMVDIAVLVFSTALSWWLSEIMGLGHRWVWLICLIISSIVSFIALKHYIFKVKQE